MSKIYRKTFVKKATECISKLDEGVGIVEEQITQLAQLQHQLGTDEYDKIIERMHSFVMDLYSLKHEYTDKLEESA